MSKIKYFLLAAAIIANLFTINVNIDKDDIVGLIGKFYPAIKSDSSTPAKENTPVVHEPQEVNGSIRLTAEDYYNRGVAHYNSKQHALTVQDLDKAIELNPNFVLAYNNRGVAYNDLKQYEQAIQDLNKAVELDPNFVFAYNNRALAYYWLRNLQQSVADANKAIELNPNYANPYQIRGLCYQQLGETAKAQADFTKAKQLGFSG